MSFSCGSVEVPQGYKNVQDLTKRFPDCCINIVKIVNGTSIDNNIIRIDNTTKVENANRFGNATKLDANATRIHENTIKMEENNYVRQ